MTASDLEFRQLILAKALYLHGCAHAAQKDDVSKIVAIHHFDNAIEMVLKCAVQKEGEQSGQADTVDKIEKLDKPFEQLLKYLKDLPLKEQMRELHRLRNGVQHGGNIPSEDSVIRYKGYAEDFFRAVCDTKFGISYDELFLSGLIETKSVKDGLRKAEEAFGREEFGQCIELCDDAFQLAAFEEANIVSTAGILIGYWGASDELRAMLKEDYPEKYKDREFYDFIKELRSVIIQLGQATAAMQLLDEHRIRFLKYRYIVEASGGLSQELKDDAQFCLSFVIDVVLKWQQDGIFNLKNNSSVMAKVEQIE